MSLYKTIYGRPIEDLSDDELKVLINKLDIDTATKHTCGSRRYLYLPNGFSSNGEKRVSESIAIAELALGKQLPIKAEVHHVDGNSLNNNRSNLVICEDKMYHRLLHKRTEALKACGNARWRKCQFCKVWDDLKNLVITKTNIFHASCKSQWRRDRKEFLCTQRRKSVLTENT